MPTPIELVEGASKLISDLDRVTLFNLNPEVNIIEGGLQRKGGI